MFESEMVVNRRVGNIFELFSRSIIRAQQAAPDDRNEDLAVGLNVLTLLFPSKFAVRAAAWNY